MVEGKRILFEGVQISFLKYLMVSFNPSSRETTGFQFNNVSAFDISGLRLTGSSSGNFVVIMFDLESVSRLISSAISRIVISLGFPRLIGPMASSDECIIAIMPEMRSVT